jgi:hypothetical protein
VAAGPFAQVGDRQLRHDVELLKAAGLIGGPIDSWPLPWAQIVTGVTAAGDGRALAPHVAAAARRLRALAEMADAPSGGEARLGLTNSVAIATDFGGKARGRVDAYARRDVQTGSLSLSLGATVRSDQTGKFYNLEPSELAVRLGNWAVYAGWTEQWYGPGQDAALLWSNNPKPFPKVGVKRLVPHGIDFPVLRWLGPVRFDLFVGVLDERRRDYANQIVVGQRLNFEPSRGFEVGLNRAQQLCGEGRPCGFRQIRDSFIGFGNADNIAPGNTFFEQPGNQIAGFDLSYTHRFRSGVAVKLYAEAEAEDYDNVVLEQYGRLVGVHVTGPVGRGGASFAATVEYADTQAASLFNGTPLEGLTGGETVYPGSLYNNTLYFDGFRYDDRSLGHWADGDSRVLTASLSVTDTENRRWYAKARSVHLNFNNIGTPPRGAINQQGQVEALVRNPLSLNAEKFAMLAAGAEVPTRYGDLSAELRLDTDRPNTPDRRAPRAAVELGWRTRF